ncbi:YciI family protein [Paenarthrobacter sp. NPDC092416]|uniref:YciI family protein n=1 Tax=Paenarthrobacter sp. NPDC092416 TaxID=3364386 RepID=UPI00382D4E76
MTYYMLNIYQPDGTIPPPEQLDRIMSDVETLNDEIKSAGSWVFTGGMHPASDSTVLRPDNGTVLTTDGPFVEGKEHIGGFWVIQAEDLDAALNWGRKAATATTLPIEVRPLDHFQGS